MTRTIDIPEIPPDELPGFELCQTIFPFDPRKVEERYKWWLVLPPLEKTRFCFIARLRDGKLPVAEEDEDRVAAVQSALRADIANWLQMSPANRWDAWWETMQEVLPSKKLKGSLPKSLIRNHTTSFGYFLRRIFPRHNDAEPDEPDGSVVLVSVPDSR
ncbi:hypothetical protein ARMSODRAFT_959060 [Armillaria solidipes]|uniref:Uncharacterized protein n=1 Tax=Armillaria solidipes TaxID=1076256 RepID=A0A2H3B9F4_9AGAR|nr:hypothetical protein ARMSODRAFT_959060 [Armillaria solidipes]